MNQKASPVVWVSFAMIVGVMGAALISPLYALYQQTWQLQASDVSLIYVIYMGGALLALLLGGRLPDRIGFRPVMTVGMVLSFVGTLISMLAWDAISLTVGRFLVGVSSSIVMTSATVGLARLARPGDQHRTSVMTGFLLSLGFALGPFIGGVIGQWVPAPLVTAYVPTLIMVALGLVVLRRLPLPAETREPLSWRDVQPKLTWPAKEVSSTFILTCCLPFLAFGVFGLYASMTPLFLDKLVPWHGPAVGGIALALILLMSAIVQMLASSQPAHRTGFWGLLALAACNEIGRAHV